MAIIELNLEKPALKRVESVEEEQAKQRRTEEEQIEAEVNPEEAAEMVEEGETEMAEEMEAKEMEAETSESGGRGRIRTLGRRLAILAGTAAGLAVARKLQSRRKSGTEQQDLEEDWQTTE